MVKSNPLHESALLTPCFSIYPPPALADSCLRQEGPGQTLEALWQVVLRTPELTQVEETMTWSAREPVQVGLLLVFTETKLMGKEGSCHGSPTPCTPLNNDALPLWYPGLFPKAFPVEELFIPLPSGCLFTANSCLLLGSTFQHPTPLCNRRHTAQAGMPKGAAQTIWNRRKGDEAQLLKQWHSPRI